MQKSNKKDQGSRKMAKNYFVSLNPANSPQKFFNCKKLPAQTTPAFFELRSQSAYYVIFLTPFF
jgi:hypothetical protein